MLDWSTSVCAWWGISSCCSVWRPWVGFEPHYLELNKWQSVDYTYIRHAAHIHRRVLKDFTGILWINTELFTFQSELDVYNERELQTAGTHCLKLNWWERCKNREGVDLTFDLDLSHKLLAWSEKTRSWTWTWALVIILADTVIRTNDNLCHV